MTRYRKFETGTWTDARFRKLSSPPPNGKTLWHYLLTGQRTTIFPGLVIATAAVMADDLGWPLDADLLVAAPANGCRCFRDAWREVEGEMAVADWTSGVVVLPKALFDREGRPRETAKPGSPNQLMGWAKAWDDVPECELADHYLFDLRDFAIALDLEVEDRALEDAADRGRAGKKTAEKRAPRKTYAQAFETAFETHLGRVGVGLPPGLPQGLPQGLRDSVRDESETSTPRPPPRPTPTSSRLTRARGRGPVPVSYTSGSDQGGGSGADPDPDRQGLPGNDRSGDRQQGHPASPRQASGSAHERVVSRVRRFPPPPRAGSAKPSNRELVREFTRLVNAGRDRVAAARKMTIRQLARSPEGERDLIARLASSDDPIADLAHVARAAELEASVTGELHWFGWSVCAERPWRIRLATALPAKSGGPAAPRAGRPGDPAMTAEDRAAIADLTARLAKSNSVDGVIKDAQAEGLLP